MHDSAKQSNRPYERIVLLGHSLGALTVRKAYAYARGETADWPGELKAKPCSWAAIVSRIILLAGTNRGWQIEKRAKHMPLWKWLVFLLTATIHRWLWWTGTGTLINAARRGAPFVANLRIQWIRLCNSAQPPPPTIQILGTVDDIVDESDNVDVESGKDFIYLTVQDTGHENVVRFRNQGEVGKHREKRFLEAYLRPIGELASDRISDLQVDMSVEAVVFVMHGIRDFGHWTDGLAERVETIGKAQGLRVETISASYGYFPMMGFLLQPERQKNVRWFMDQYTEAIAAYPRARISFIGHSNGTYLLGSALRNYEACVFDRAALAGSVLPQEFDWGRFMAAASPRIRSVRNHVATADWVVAIFPAVFEALYLGDLGSAGHNGFPDQHVRRDEIRFVIGGHSAALVEANFDAIAGYVLGDDNAYPPPELLANRRNALVVLVSKLCPVIWLVLLMIIVWPSLILAKRQFVGEESLAVVMPDWTVALAWLILVYALLRRI
jgi:hypothetical protein